MVTQKYQHRKQTCQLPQLSRSCKEMSSARRTPKAKICSWNRSALGYAGMMSGTNMGSANMVYISQVLPFHVSSASLTG